MRLIDADALFRAIKNSDWLPHERIEAMKMVREQLTVDAVPAVHGRWEVEIDHDEFWGDMEYYKCSLCGNLELREKETPYCPNCGARMDGADVQNT